MYISNYVFFYVYYMSRGEYIIRRYFIIKGYTLLFCPWKINRRTINLFMQLIIVSDRKFIITIIL